MTEMFMICALPDSHRFKLKSMQGAGGFYTGKCRSRSWFRGKHQHPRKAGSDMDGGWLCPSHSYFSRCVSEVWQFALGTNCQVMLLEVHEPHFAQHWPK